MTEIEVYNKVKEAIAALDEYGKNLNEKKGLWNDDIKKALPTLQEKMHAVGASGSTCPRCGGSGRV